MLDRRDRQNHPRLNLALTTAATLGAAVAIGYAYRFQIDHLEWTPLPEASLQALRGCPDNLYNRYDEGGYLIWFEPNMRAYLYTPEQLQRSLILRPIVERKDGVIYDVRPRPGVTPECSQ